MRQCAATASGCRLRADSADAPRSRRSRFRRRRSNPAAPGDDLGNQGRVRDDASGGVHIMGASRPFPPVPQSGLADEDNADPLDLDGAWPARAVSRTVPWVSTAPRTGHPLGERQGDAAAPICRSGREAWFRSGRSVGGGQVAMAAASPGGSGPRGQATRWAARMWRTASRSSTVASRAVAPAVWAGQQVDGNGRRIRAVQVRCPVVVLRWKFAPGAEAGAKSGGRGDHLEQNL